MEEQPKFQSVMEKKQILRFICFTIANGLFVCSILVGLWIGITTSMDAYDDCRNCYTLRLGTRLFLMVIIYLAFTSMSICIFFFIGYILAMPFYLFTLWLDGKLLCNNHLFWCPFSNNNVTDIEKNVK